MINITQEEIMKNWQGDINQPLVSVRCITYNHENYIAQALDGFLMQKTNFPFEVIVHDDASPDRTADIVREYEKKYPAIIKAIYQTENQYSKRDGTIARILNEACKGKYIAFCEGDDYWIDENKLQMQVDFLENNPEYSAYYGNIECIDGTGNPSDYAYKVFPKYANHTILKSDPHYYPLIGHISTCMIRSIFVVQLYKDVDFRINGDNLISIIASGTGDVYYSGKIFSKYRVTFDGDSWTARTYKKDMLLFGYKSCRDGLIFSEKVLQKKYCDGNFSLSKILLRKLIRLLKSHEQKDILEFKEMMSLCDYKIMLPFYFLKAILSKLKLFNSKRPRLKN